MRRRRAALVPVVAVLLLACGPRAELRYAATSLEAAHDGFLAYVKARGERIVRTATSEAAGKAALDDLFERADKVQTAFEAAFIALAIAAARPEDANLANVVSALSAAKKAWDDFHGGTP